MRIDTKYKINEKIFTMFDNKIVERTIEKILIEIHSNGTTIIEYKVIEGKKYESEIFKTKEELIASL